MNFGFGHGTTESECGFLVHFVTAAKSSRNVVLTIGLGTRLTYSHGLVYRYGKALFLRSTVNSPRKPVTGVNTNDKLGYASHFSRESHNDFKYWSVRVSPIDYLNRTFST